jgi:hypothetical protein
VPYAKQLPPRVSLFSRTSLHLSHTPLLSSLPLSLPLLVYNSQLIKTHFPCADWKREIIITDRPFHERQKWHELLGAYMFSCSKHLERGVKNAVGGKIWKKKPYSGKDCFRELISVTGDGPFSKAKESMETKFPTMLTLILESDARQQVYSTAELLAAPYLMWSFTRYALQKHCEETGATLPYYALGKSPACTNNAAEGANAAEKFNGIRYQAPLEWAKQKFASENGRLQRVRSALGASSERLIPRAREVFHAAKMKMYLHSLRGPPGLFGFMTINNVLATGAGPLYSSINIRTRTCDHPNCIRVRFNRDNCVHLLCGFQKSGAMDRRDFFEAHYPPNLLSSSVCTLIDTFPPHVSPNLGNMRIDEALPIRRAPQPKSSRVKGRPKNNSIRWPSRGELDAEAVLFWARGWGEEEGR